MQASIKYPSRKGFALLITVTLLAFLVLLLVSLAALTRVETQVASNNQQVVQARQNALMALNIALGELQKYTGPDQRTTARADLNAVNPNVSTKSGRWLGAYGRAVTTADTVARDLYADTPSKVASDTVANSSATGQQAQLLNWLVSGNEGTSFNPSTAIDPNGLINSTLAPTTFAYVPSGAVVGLSASATALSTNITVAKTLGGTQSARLLVGPNTVTSPSDYVAAPVVDITTDSSNIPGAGTGGGDIPIGRYAWWVGDEGAKARINLPIASTSATRAIAFFSSTRAGVELVDGVHGAGGWTTFLSSDLIGPAYDPASSRISSLINTRQLPLLNTASAGALITAAKYRFHDLSGYSTSVLSDTYAGGLKRDLSAALADTSPSVHPSPEADTDFIFPSEPPTSGSSTNVNELGLPTWGQLRSYAQTTDTNGNATSGLNPAPPKMQQVGSAPPRPTGVGISPIMTYFVMGFKYVAPGAYDLDGNPDPANHIRLAVYPIVVLWNPYTTDILPKKYEVGIQRTSYARIELSGHSGPKNDSYSWSAANKIENRNLIYADDTNTSDPYFRFIVDSTRGIKAGQSVVYTLQSSEGEYQSANQNLPLSDIDYYPFSYVLLKDKGGVVGTATPAIPATGSNPAYTAGQGTYRVGVNRSATKQFYYGAKAIVNYFDTAWSDYEGFSWGGNGEHQAYLSDLRPSSVKPSGTTPYTVTGSTYTSREWYQSLGNLWAGNLNEAPFGYNISYPTDPAASAVISTGPNTGLWAALLQPEGRLEVAGSRPAWRMISKLQPQELNSTWLTQGNPRGFLSTSTALYSYRNFSGGTPGNAPGPQVSASQWPPFTVEPLPVPARARGASDWWASSGAAADATLFEFRPGTQPLFSIGQLQHANMAWLGSSPTYAIGNSVAPNFLNNYSIDIGGGNTVTLPAARETLVRLQSSFPGLSGGYLFKAIYDQSWLLNWALWDRYFVSTIPNVKTGTDADASITPGTDLPPVLPNPRHIAYDTVSAPVMRTVEKASSHLLLSGGFNINSTSEQAWRAILGGTNKLSYDPTGNDPSGAYDGPVYSRFSKPTTNLTTNTWLGYRRLSEVQISQLAKNIVAEIRSRGPFISLSDFINRRLKDNTATSLDERANGTIQAALDNTTTPALINPATPISFSPQYLTQADVLSTIGSGLSARSDTFVIRTYGETLDTVNSVTSARAWCEAVVQRVPDYVDSSMPAETLMKNAAPSVTKTTNQAFGRKFKIISFRWLSSNDI